MTALLGVADVSVWFGGLEALRSVSIAVHEGRTTGLIGPNGAGKTTMLQVISGLRAPDTGRVLLGGRDITRLRPWDRAGLGMGRSFQTPGLALDETVEANVLAGRHLRAGYAALDPVFRPWRYRRGERGLREGLDRLLRDFGLEDRRHELAAELTFEQVRFAELAAVLSGAPELLLLDEPTAGIELAGRERLATLLGERAREGAATLLVTHDLPFMSRLCDHAYVLAGGRLVAEGPPDQLQGDERVINAYLGARG